MAVFQGDRLTLDQPQLLMLEARSRYQMAVDRHAGDAVGSLPDSNRIKDVVEFAREALAELKP